MKKIKIINKNTGQNLLIPYKELYLINSYVQIISELNKFEYDINEVKKIGSWDGINFIELDKENEENARMKINITSKYYNEFVKIINEEDIQVRNKVDDPLEQNFLRMKEFFFYSKKPKRGIHDKCECGADFTEGRHSDFCKLSRREN